MFKHSLNTPPVPPQFSKNFLLNYHFEEIQKLKFLVVDIDDKHRVEDISRHDLIGELECTLADLVTAGQKYTRTLRLKGLKKVASCVISVVLSSKRVMNNTSVLVLVHVLTLYLLFLAVHFECELCTLSILYIYVHMHSH